MFYNGTLAKQVVYKLTSNAEMGKDGVFLLVRKNILFFAYFEISTTFIAPTHFLPVMALTRVSFT